MDARMCFERHATSKISNADDLFALKTMGFRGEAMASIAAIAQIQLKSKLADSDIGTCIKIAGSKVESQEPCQCAVGTTIIVKNLFFNVPARRNFLKSDTVELRHIVEEFIRISVINYNVGFSYYNNDKVVFKLLSGSLKSRIVALFGPSYNEKIIKIEQNTDIVKINGFIGKPEFVKKTRGEQYFFVNGRFIKHHYLHHAVNNAYTELMPTGSFPSYFINIEIDPQDIDINIHPTKTEVNFLDARYIYSVLQAAAKQSIGKHSLTPTLDFDVIPEIEAAILQRPSSDFKQPTVTVDAAFNPFSTPNSNPSSASNTHSYKKNIPDNWESLYQNSNADAAPPQTNNDLLAKAMDSEMGFERNKFIQVHNRFIVCNVSTGMMLINQNFAHERIIYEETLEKLKGSTQPSQQQLFPQTVQLSPDDAQIINSLSAELVKIGFVLEEQEPNNFLVVGVPTDMLDNDINSILEKIIDNDKAHISDLNYDKNINLARSIASNTAIKLGVRLTDIEMQDIFNKLFMCNVPKVSPSGKKILRIISIDELNGLIE